MKLEKLKKTFGLSFLLSIFLFPSIAISDDAVVTDDDDILDMIIPILAAIKTQSPRTSITSELQNSFEIKKGELLKKVIRFSPKTSGYYTVRLVNTKTDKKRVGSIQVTSDCGNCLQVESSKKEGALNKTLKYDFYAEAGYEYQINLAFKEASLYSVNVNALKIGSNDSLPINNNSIAFNAPVEPSVKTEVMLQRDSLEQSGIFSKIGFQDLYWKNGNLRIAVKFESHDMSGFRPGNFPIGGTICDGIKNNDQCKTKVIDHIVKTASRWTEKTSLKFSKTDNWYDAHIRILVLDYISSGTLGNSLIGVQSLSNMQAPSMYLITETVNSDSETKTILHEFGHALGLGHEHINPSIILDKTAVYNYCQTNKMSKDNCDANMFLSDELGTVSFTDYDPYSVMNYDIPRSWVADKSKCTPNSFSLYCNETSGTLSAIDLKAIQQAYPLKPINVTYKAECITAGTSLTGARKNCDTKNLCSNAPKYYGFSYVSKSLYDSNNGNCDVQLKNVISGNLGGNTQIYNQVCYRAWASSPGGINNINARGWAKCNIDASLLPFK